jgi:hypothetical protein
VSPGESGPGEPPRPLDHGSGQEPDTHPERSTAGQVGRSTGLGAYQEDASRRKASRTGRSAAPPSPRRPAGERAEGRRWGACNTPAAPRLRAA